MVQTTDLMRLLDEKRKSLQQVDQRLRAILSRRSSLPRLNRCPADTQSDHRWKRRTEICDGEVRLGSLRTTLRTMTQNSLRVLNFNELLLYRRDRTSVHTGPSPPYRRNGVTVPAYESNSAQVSASNAVNPLTLQ